MLVSTNNFSLRIQKGFFSPDPEQSTKDEGLKGDKFAATNIWLDIMMIWRILRFFSKAKYVVSAVFLLPASKPSKTFYKSFLHLGATTFLATDVIMGFRALVVF